MFSIGIGELLRTMNSVSNSLLTVVEAIIRLGFTAISKVLLAIFIEQIAIIIEIIAIKAEKHSNHEFAKVFIGISLIIFITDFSG